MSLTPKQLKFAHNVASGMSLSDSYRASYDASGMSNPAIWVESCRLQADPNVSLMISELRVPIEEQVGITLKSYVEEMQALKNAAFNAEEYGASIKALELTGKCLGYYVNKTELTGRNGGAIEHKVVREIIDPENGNNLY
jgi:hypothetical protein